MSNQQIPRRIKGGQITGFFASFLWFSVCSTRSIFHNRYIHIDSHIVHSSKLYSIPFDEDPVFQPLLPSLPIVSIPNAPILIPFYPNSM